MLKPNFQYHYFCLQCPMILQKSFQSADLLLKEHFLVLSMVKKVVLCNIFGKPWYVFYEIFCNIKHVCHIWSISSSIFDLSLSLSLSLSLTHTHTHTHTHTKVWIFKDLCSWQDGGFSSSLQTSCYVCKSSRRMQKIKNDWFQIVQKWPYNSIQTDYNNCLPCWCIQIHVVLIHDRETREQNKAQSWFQQFGFLCFWINNNNKICYVLSET